MGDRKDMTRSEWLNARGFVIDPFMPGSYRAETDILFELSGFPSYVDRIDLALLVGNFKSPGYHFIFAPQGGGKSSLRRRIHLEYEELVMGSKVLIIDYLDHSYSHARSNVSDHVGRIVRLVEDIVAVDMREVKRLVKSSPVLSLKTLVRTCKRLGFSGVYVLVDNLDGNAFQKIGSLIEETAVFGIEGFILKFFMPENLLLIAQSFFPFDKYPPYFLAWDRIELLKVLNQRLIACYDPELLITSRAHPISLLFEGYQNLAIKVEDTLVKLGELGNAPSLMWQLGNYLIEEHVHDRTGHQIGDLINEGTFARARLRLFDEFLKSGRISNYKAGNDFNVEHQRIMKVPTGRSPKARIFLCYAEEDEELVYEGLYQELQVKNYQPWMRRDVIPGENRDLAIKSAVEKSDFFLLCLSPRATKERGYFQKELKWALSKQEGMKADDIYIIPVRLEKCIPPDSLEQWYADWFIESQRERIFMAIEEGKIRRRRKK